MTSPKPPNATLTLTGPYAFILTEDDIQQAATQIWELSQKVRLLKIQKAAHHLAMFLKQEPQIDGFEVNRVIWDTRVEGAVVHLGVQKAKLTLYSDTHLSELDRTILHDAVTLRLNQFLRKLAGPESDEHPAFSKLSTLSLSNLHSLSQDSLTSQLMQKMLDESVFSAWEQAYLAHQLPAEESNGNVTPSRSFPKAL